MTRSRLLFLLLSLAVVLPVLTVTLSRAATDASDTEDSLSKNLSIFSEVLSLIRRAYVEETSMDDLLVGALEGSTDALDPMATFVPRDSVGDYEEATRIGRRHSGLLVGKDRGIAFALAVDEGSPAEKAGLERGDILAKIDGASTRRMPLWRLQTILTGGPGTVLELEVLRRGQTRDLTLTLGSYEPRRAEMEDVDGFDLLHLPRFETEDLPTVRTLLDDLSRRGRSQLLIDVRGVAGGSSEDAYALAGLFVRGELGTLDRRGSDYESVQFQSMEVPAWEGELVVLVDNGTQGPAEIFATILRQSAGARLVGLRTFGHAGRQRSIPLSDGSLVRMADAFYTGPDGEPIVSSLVPDEAVNVFERTEDDSAADPILERALEVLRDRVDAERDVA